MFKCYKMGLSNNIPGQ